MIHKAIAKYLQVKYFLNLGEKDIVDTLMQIIPCNMIFKGGKVGIIFFIFLPKHHLCCILGG